MINVIIASPFREEYKEQIIASGKDRCHFDFVLPDTPQEEAELLLKEAEVIIGYVSPALLPCAKKLRWLQLTWAGVDAVIKRAPENAVLTNASGAFGTVIAEHIMACLLSLSRHIPAYARQGKWQALGCEATLEGKRALILGAGDIGCCTAQRLKAFNTVTVGIRRVPRSKPACFDEMYSLDELDGQLKAADFVLCCLPGTEQTKGLLNHERLLMMKDSAILVNVGRGTLIDTAALESIMAQGKLFGAALDVTDPEPLPENSPLWNMDNVIITPHVAGIGFGHLPETEKRIADICCENLRRYMLGEELINIVDMSTGYRRTLS